MDKTALSILFLSAYFVLVLGVSWLYRTKNHDQGFAIGGRKVGFWPTTASLISGTRDGGGLALWITVGAVASYQFYWILVGLLAGFFLQALQGPLVRDLAVKKNLITLSDFVWAYIGPHTAKLMSVVVVIFTVTLAAAQLYVSGQILGALLGQPFMVGAIICGGLVGVYLLIGGYRSLVVTDLLQWGAMTAILVLPFLYFDLPSMDVVMPAFWDDNWALSAAYMIAGATFTYAAPDIWQRVFSVENGKVARMSFLTAIPLFFLITAGLTVFGYYLGNLFPHLPGDKIFYLIFQEPSVTPIVAALAGVTFISITLSTLDSQTYMFTATVTKNFLNIDNKKHHDRYVRWNRMLTIIFMVLLILVASTIQDLIKFLFDTALIMTVFPPILFYGLWFRNKKARCSDNAVFLVFLTGVLLYYGMFFLGYFSDFIDNLIPLEVTIVMLSVFHLLFKRRL